MKVTQAKKWQSGKVMAGGFLMLLLAGCGGVSLIPEQGLEEEAFDTLATDLTMLGEVDGEVISGDDAAEARRLAGLDEQQPEVVEQREEPEQPTRSVFSRAWRALTGQSDPEPEPEPEPAPRVQEPAPVVAAPEPPPRREPAPVRRSRPEPVVAAPEPEVRAPVRPRVEEITETRADLALAPQPEEEGGLGLGGWILILLGLGGLGAGAWVVARRGMGS